MPILFRNTAVLTIGGMETRLTIYSQEGLLRVELVPYSTNMTDTVQQQSAGGVHRYAERGGDLRRSDKAACGIPVYKDRFGGFCYCLFLRYSVAVSPVVSRKMRAK